MYPGFGIEATDVGSVLEKHQFSVAARTVVQTSNDQPVGLQLVPGQSSGSPEPSPMDAATVTAIVSALRLELGPPTSPLLFAMDVAQLPLLPQVRTLGDQALIASLNAEQVMTHPGRALNFIRIARSRNWEVGLYGVGGSANSLRAAIIVEPALIILDTKLLTHPDSRFATETRQTVQALAQTTGAAVMSPSADKRLRADAARIGATLSIQNSPGTFYSPAPNSTFNLFNTPALPAPRASIFVAASGCYRPRSIPKAELLTLSRQIETLACAASPATTVFACLQRARHLTPATRTAYQQLVHSDKLVIMAAKGLHRPVQGARSINLDRYDPLTQEWVLAVFGPTTSVLLVGAPRRQHPDRPEDNLKDISNREGGAGPVFDFILTDDRDLTSYAARTAMLRL